MMKYSVDIAERSRIMQLEKLSVSALLNSQLSVGTDNKAPLGLASSSATIQNELYDAMELPNATKRLMAVLVFHRFVERMIAEGRPVSHMDARKEAAAFTRSSERSVYRWISRWSSGGAGALADDSWGGGRDYRA